MKKKRAKVKQAGGTRKLMRRRVTDALVRIGHRLDRWIHSPFGKEHTAAVRCLDCNTSANLDLKSGKAITTGKPCQGKEKIC